MTTADSVSPEILLGSRDHRDWTHLGPELLRLIAAKLPSIADLLRFRCVCPPWRLAAAPPLPLSAPSLPWLLLPYSLPSPLRSFLDLSSLRTLTLSLPAAQSKWAFGSPHAHLVLLDPTAGAGLAVSLLNPLTKTLIPLPFLPLQPRLFPSNGGLVTEKVILSNNPALFPPSEVLVAIWIRDIVCFCRLEDEDWTVIRPGKDQREKGEFVLYKGEFYFVSGIHSGGVFDFREEKLVPIASPWGFTGDESTMVGHHLVESSGEMLLLGRYPDKEFIVLKLERARSGKLRWENVGDCIGKSILFVSRKQSLAICGKDLVVWKGCRFYYAGEDFLEGCRSGCGAERVVTVQGYDVVAGNRIRHPEKCWQSTEEIDGDRTGWVTSPGVSWFVPSLCEKEMTYVNFMSSLWLGRSWRGRSL